VSAYLRWSNCSAVHGSGPGHLWRWRSHSRNFPQAQPHGRRGTGQQLSTWPSPAH
jgi:hypothetical protein